MPVLAEASLKKFLKVYNLPEGGYTVSITKEKFLNTYPPLFNPACLQKMQAGRIFNIIGKYSYDIKNAPQGCTQCAKEGCFAAANWRAKCN